MAIKDKHWKVFIYQNNDIIEYDIFKHEGFCEALEEIKHFKDMSDERVKIELAYWFRNRSECEISVASIFARSPQKNISVYDQVMLNFDRFIEYLRS